MPSGQQAEPAALPVEACHCPYGQGCVAGSVTDGQVHHSGNAEIGRAFFKNLLKVEAFGCVSGFVGASLEIAKRQTRQPLSHFKGNMMKALSPFLTFSEIHRFYR